MVSSTLNSLHISKCFCLAVRESWGKRYAWLTAQVDMFEEKHRMICPKCRFQQNDANEECLKCGIVFKKYQGLQSALTDHQRKKETKEETTVEVSQMARDILFSAQGQTNPIIFGAKVTLLLVLLVWSFKLGTSSIAGNDAGSSFLHYVNLPFHEAGHIVFRPFGRFITSLGGTLGQMLMPLTCMAVLLLKTRDPFGASVSLWWFGENFLDIAPYINDARAGEIMLLGGNTGKTSPYGFHDWEYILNEMGLLSYDNTIARISFTIGLIIMFTSIVWAGFLLLKQYKSIRRDN